MKIREAGIGDVEQLKELYNHSVGPLYNEIGGETNVEAWLNMFKEDLDKTKNYVLEGDKKIIGFINAKKFKHFYSGEDRLEILMLMVHQDHQKKGYGKKLVDKMIGFAKQENIKKIVLSTLIKNKNAVDFYGKNGFKPHRYIMERDI